MSGVQEVQCSSVQPRSETLDRGTDKPETSVKHQCDVTTLLVCDRPTASLRTLWAHPGDSFVLHNSDAQFSECAVVRSHGHTEIVLYCLPACRRHHNVHQYSVMPRVLLMLFHSQCVSGRGRREEARLDTRGRGPRPHPIIIQAPVTMETKALLPASKSALTNALWVMQFEVRCNSALNSYVHPLLPLDRHALWAMQFKPGQRAAVVQTDGGQIQLYSGMVFILSMELTSCLVT